MELQLARDGDRDDLNFLWLAESRSRRVMCERVCEQPWAVHARAQRKSNGYEVTVHEPVDRSCGGVERGCDVTRHAICAVPMQGTQLAKRFRVERNPLGGTAHCKLRMRMGLLRNGTATGEGWGPRRSELPVARGVALAARDV